MPDQKDEARKKRDLFILTAGAVGCFLILPMLFMPLFLLIENYPVRILMHQLYQHGSTIAFIVFYTRRTSAGLPLSVALNLEKTPEALPAVFLRFFIRMFLLIIAANILVQVISGILSLNLPDQPLKQELIHGSWALFFVLFFASVCLAPVAEELLFRGVLYKAFNTVLDKTGAAIVMALIFAMLHWNALNFLSLFLMAIVLQKAVEQTHTLRTAIWMHLLNNLITVLLLLIQRLAAPYF